jgi:PhnB protein
MSSVSNRNPVPTSLAPWLSVPNAAKAATFYTEAFGAQETYRFEDPSGGIVIKLCADAAEFWLSQDSESGANPEPIGGETVRMILTVADPDAVFQSALRAGATEIFPVGEEHGWRLGRLADPFGLHWEIGHQLNP